MGRILITAGIVLLLLGLLLTLAPGALSWFGRLPGDVRIERAGYTLYLPFTSMVLASLLLTLLLNLFFRR